MFSALTLLLKAQDRFKHSESITNRSECQLFCDNYRSDIVDAETATKFKNFFDAQLNKTSCVGQIEDSCSVHMNVIHDFERGSWVNGISGSELDGDLWYQPNNTLPVFPIMDDILGTGISSYILSKYARISRVSYPCRYLLFQNWTHTTVLYYRIINWLLRQQIEFFLSCITRAYNLCRRWCSKDQKE